MLQWASSIQCDINVYLPCYLTPDTSNGLRNHSLFCKFRKVLLYLGTRTLKTCSIFGVWLFVLMNSSCNNHFLCAFCVISQGDYLVGLDHEQWVYRLEHPTRKLHSKSKSFTTGWFSNFLCMCAHQNHSSPHILFWPIDWLIENILTWT